MYSYPLSVGIPIPTDSRPLSIAGPTCQPGAAGDHTLELTKGPQLRGGAGRTTELERGCCATNTVRHAALASEPDGEQDDVDDIGEPRDVGIGQPEPDLTVAQCYPLERADEMGEAPLVKPHP